MIRREGLRIVVSGPVGFANLRRVLEQGLEHVADGIETVDLSEVGEVDSSLLAAMLAWLREARSRRAGLTFVNLPEGLTTLARVYGVEGLLPGTAAQ